MSISNILTNAVKLDSELLRTFLTVSEAGSFSKGAIRIFRSQSAVSLQIKQLENVLGTAVFQRRARGVELTPVGEQLRPVAQQVIDLLDKTLGKLKGSALQGSIRIGIPEEYGETFLQDVIAQFVRNHPQVELSVRCGFSTSFPEALAREEIDLAVYAVESPDNDVLLLRKERTHWVTSKNHMVHEQDPLPVALFERACWWRDRALEALEESGKRFQVVFTSESVMGITAAISTGVAVGLVGEGSLRDEFKILRPGDGFPAVRDSALVLECRNGVSTSISQAISHAIMAAFNRD